MLFASLSPSVSIILPLALLSLFHYESHFAYHHTVLFCDTIIHYYLTIAHFFQVLPFAHHITYLGTFSTTFICYPVFVFFLEISVDNRQIYPLGKIHNHRSLFLIPALYLPIISSSPMFPLPTCPFRSTARTILYLSTHFLSTHPGLAKNHFSPPCCG